MSAKRLVAALVASAGAAAFTACLLALADGMRDVIRPMAGVCQRWALRHRAPVLKLGHPPDHDRNLRRPDRRWSLRRRQRRARSKAASAGLILWAALFGTLGWNFVSVGRHPGASGMLFTGVLFLAMAVGGLIPLLLRLADDLRRPASGPAR